MRIIMVCAVFFILSFLHMAVIRRGRFFTEKPIMIPNIWAWHAVIGIFCVVSANYMFIWPYIVFTPRSAYLTLFATFLSAFPGIYLGSVGDWDRYNEKINEAIEELGKIKTMILN